jgi:superfamily I DNA/RNA helicase
MAYPQLCIEALMSNSDPPQCDVLIVDEAQDLLLERYVDVFDLLLKGGLTRGIWRAFLDPNQNIFQGVNPEGMQRLQEAHPNLYRLTVNCRNTAPIANTVAMLSGIEADKTLVVTGPEVETYWYRDAAMQTRLVSRHVNRLLSEGLHPTDIVLLSHRKLNRSCLASGLAEVPYKMKEFEKGSLKPGSALRFSTIAGFKGLEADVVVIVDIDDLSSEKSHSSLYVGASRARGFLSVFINEEARPAYESMKSQFDRQSTRRG